MRRPIALVLGSDGTRTLVVPRHSDTVLVTDEGIEVLTYYPRDLARLVIPA